MSREKRNIVFIGFMGTGKTTIARELSKAIGCRFVDSDKIISEESGMTVEEIFETLGEEIFRKIEREVIKNISNLENAVISVGGGAVVDPENVFNLRKNGILILLTASPETILANISKSETRPLLKKANVLEEIKQLLKKREEAYKNYDYEISVDNLSVEEVLNRAIKLLKENNYI